MQLYPWQDVLTNADAHIRNGFTVYQQFNCAYCGAKQTIDTPNTFHRQATCEECGKLTDIERNGHNFMAHITGKDT